MRGNAFIILLMSALALAALSYAPGAVVGSSRIYAPAVISGSGTGSLTTISLVVVNGSGNVSIAGPVQVSQDTLVSAQDAARAASSYLRKAESGYDFTYGISGAANVSGPSGGLAMALLAVSALKGEPDQLDFAATGTISGSGRVGAIGGVYDKASAAKAKGLSFMLVPYVNNSSFEAEQYVLAQAAFGILIVPVANLSQALLYSSSPSLAASNKASYRFYTNYNLSLPDGASECAAGNCTMQQFGSLANYTFNLSRREISALPDSLSAVRAELLNSLSQDAAIAGKGYLYLGANLAFLDYINAFLFEHANYSVDSAAALVSSTGEACASLRAPPLTRYNYEYVLGGGLRQQWAEQTLSVAANVLSTAPEIDSDQIASVVNGVAQATAWCGSAEYMYSIAKGLGGNASSVIGIGQLASRVTAEAGRYASLNSLYSESADAALAARNYPLALLSASYAVAFSQAVPNGSAEGLAGEALRIASNATFGTWALQFSNEARFYAYQAQLPVGSSLKLAYAQQAYQIAQLAVALSSSFSVISSNMSESAARAYKIDEGQKIVLNVLWAGGVPPYRVSWYSDRAACTENSTKLGSYDVNGTSASLTVQPVNSTYYCASVTDSSSAQAAVATFSAYVSVEGALDGLISGSVQGQPAAGQLLSMLALVVVVMAAAVAALAIELYRFKRSIRMRPGRRRER